MLSLYFSFHMLNITECFTGIWILNNISNRIDNEFHSFFNAVLLSNICDDFVFIEDISNLSLYHNLPLFSIEQSL